MGKKKTQRQQDFQKVKLKVGKKLPKSQNETKISLQARQLIIKDQLKSKPQTELATKKRLSVPDLLSHLSHFNASMRNDGISGLEELLRRDRDALLASFSAIVDRLAPIFTDKDENVRKAARTLMRKIFAHVVVDQMEPFFPLVMAHLCCAMSHIDEGIRRDSLDVVDVCLQFYPSLVVRDVNRVLDHFLLQISAKREGQNLSGHATSALLVSPSNKFSTVRWRTEVFRRLEKVFCALMDEEDKGDQNRNSPSGQEQILTSDDDSHPFVNPMTSSPFSLRDSCFNSASEVEGNSSGLALTSLQQFGETMIPLLLESWVEASPLDLASGSVSRGQYKTLPGDVFGLFAAITNLLQLLLNFSEKMHLDCDASLHTTFFKKFLPDFAKHFIPSFPVQNPSVRSKSGKSVTSPSWSRCSPEASPSSVNLAICDILTTDLRIFAKKKQPVWLDIVFGHFEHFFGNLHLETEKEIGLGFKILKRCLKSHRFCQGSIKQIFKELTFNFFKLPTAAQILVLDFFAEFLVEYSALVADGNFIEMTSFNSWLSCLPSHLRSRLKKEDSGSKHGEIHSLASKSLHLFTTASRVGLSALFPVTSFMVQTLDSSVFPRLPSRLQKSLLSQIGHADLRDKKLLSHLTEFVVEKFHDCHVYLLEILAWKFFRTAEIESQSLILICLSVILKRPLNETETRVEKRLSTHYISVGGKEVELLPYVDSLGCDEEESKMALHILTRVAVI